MIFYSTCPICGAVHSFLMGEKPMHVATICGCGNEWMVEVPVMVRKPERALVLAMAKLVRV